MFYVNTTLNESTAFDENTVIGLAGAYKFMYECELEWGKICTALSIAQVLNEHGIEYDGGVLLEAEGDAQPADQGADAAGTPTVGGDQSAEPDGDTSDSHEPTDQKKPNIIVRFLTAIRDFFRKIFKKSDQIIKKAQVVQKVRLKRLGQFWAQYGNDIMALANGKTIKGKNLQSYGPFNGYTFPNLDSNIEDIDRVIRKVGESAVTNWHPIKNRNGAYNDERYNKEIANVQNAVLKTIKAPSEGESFNAKVKAAMFGTQGEIDVKTVARMLMRIDPANKDNYEAAQKKANQHITNFTNILNQLENTINESLKVAKEGKELSAGAEKNNNAVNFKAKIIGECAKMISEISTLYSSAYQARLKQVYQWALQCIGHGTENMDAETGEDAKSDYNRADQARAAEGNPAPATA